MNERSYPYAFRVYITVLWAHLPPYPEGDQYCWNDTCLIVTRIDLRRPDAERQVMEIYEYLFEVYGGVADLPACEVYINGSPSGDMEYYFIDPETKQPFWVQDVQASDLGLLPFDSFGALSMPSILAFHDSP